VWRSGRGKGGEVAQTMYTQISKCKNNKIKEKERNLKNCVSLSLFNWLNVLFISPV
jgi:hypothetical protein